MLLRIAGMRIERRQLLQVWLVLRNRNVFMSKTSFRFCF